MIQEHMPTCSLIQSRDFSRIADLNESIPSYANIPLALTWQCLKYYSLSSTEYACSKEFGNWFSRNNFSPAMFIHMSCSWVFFLATSMVFLKYSTAWFELRTGCVFKKVWTLDGETIPIMTLFIIFPQKNNLRISYMYSTVWRLQINFNWAEFS